MTHPCCLTVLAAATLVAAVGGASPMKLIERGKSHYRIIIPEDATPAEHFAAEELQAGLQRMTGVTLPIASPGRVDAERCIVLGPASADVQNRYSGEEQALGPDSFRLQTKGQALFITGGRPRGTLNGVYALLEEKLGFRWFTPEVEVVPKTNRVFLPHLDETVIPPLEYREVFWTEMMRDGTFAARHRLNGNSHKLTEKHGGRFAVYQPFVHSFDALVPPELFATHPEYFPLIDGKRTGGYVQRCLSNPDVLALSIKKVREWIQTHPEANIISVSQNDTFKNCECPECKAVDDAEGTPAGSLLRFVNQIADNIEPDFPRIRIDTLAYQYTRKPPKTIRPHRNVIIRLCSIECCFAHPLDECDSEANRRFQADIKAWHPVAPSLYVWDYTPNFAHYQQPFPNLDALQRNVQFFARNGVTGLFEQGNYSGGGAGELGPLRAYLLAKLLWNPDCALERHIQEFCDAYYGEASPFIRQYLTLMQNEVRGRPVHAHIFDPPTAKYLSKEFITSAEETFDLAETAAGQGPHLLRVQTARLPIWYVKLARNLVSASERGSLLDKFLVVARQAGVSNISESQSLQEWEAKQRSK